MPKISANPGLRFHKCKSKDGGPSGYYYFDRRGQGEPDIPLGPDREKAVALAEVIRSGGKFTPWRPAARAGKAPTATIKRLDKLQPKTRRRLPKDLWVGAPHWAKFMYLSAERRSIKAGRAEFMTVPEFLAVVLRAKGRCEVSGVNFDERKADAGKRRPFGPSLDRMDSRKGYVAGNVRLVCLLVNQALGDWGDGPVNDFVQAMLRKQSPITSAKHADVAHSQQPA